MFDPELQDFKRQIDLRQYAASLGYQRSAKESWAGTDVMRHPTTDDKIVVKFGTERAPNHWGYFSVRGDNDHGSIIDFVKHRLKLSIGAIRVELRPWVGEPPMPVPSFPPPVRTNQDRTTVVADYAKMKDAQRHSYLENERCIPYWLLQQDRFEGRIRIDEKLGNAIFPHMDAEGLCGFEKKNRGFTGFSAGGKKGLWLSHELPEDRKFVLCESAIDALSYAALFPDSRTRYASIGGNPNPQQPELIRAASARMPIDSEIIAAMDADADGAKLAEIVRQAVALTGRFDLKFTMHEPFGYKDWNDQLRVKPQPLSSYRQDAPSVS